MSDQMDAPIFGCAGRYGGKISYKPTDLIIDAATADVGKVVIAKVAGVYYDYVVSVDNTMVYNGASEEGSLMAHKMYEYLVTEQTTDPDDLFTFLAEEISILASGDKADTDNAYSLLTQIYAMFLSKKG